jgi:hypothetical protein
MILALRNQKPSIEFELGKTTITANSGDVITVAVTTLYNDNYNVQLITSGLSVAIKISNFVWGVLVSNTDPVTVQAIITNEELTFEKYSNTIIINPIT